MPEKKQIPFVTRPEDYPWAFQVKNAKFFFESPIVINAALRARLDAFKNRDAEAPWGWLVVTTRAVTNHDVLLLTGEEKSRASSHVIVAHQKWALRFITLRPSSPFNRRANAF